MVAANQTLDATSDTAMFLRLWDRATLTPALARQLLKLAWTAEDEARMRDLAARNRAGNLSKGESQELENYLRVGMTVSILQSRARKVLKVATKRGAGS